MSKKIVIVGGVAGGASAAARLRRLDEFADIIMFDEGPFVSFSNCSIPFHIEGLIESSAELLLMTPEKFDKQYNIKAKTYHKVLKINPDKRSVSVKNLISGEIHEESYDELILSPGSSAVMPKSIKGIDGENVFAMKTIPHLTDFMSYLKRKQVKNIAVVGGGFIGIEVVQALKNAGYSVSLIEAQKQILAPLDYDMVQIVNREMDSQGVELLPEESVVEITDREVILASGKKVSAEAVIMSAGIRPNNELALDAGIEVNDRGYIKVNQHYQTSLPHVYAIGDVIEVSDFFIGKRTLALAGPAQKQARAAADHIYGRTCQNQGVIGSSSVKVFDLNIASTGWNEKQCMTKGVDYRFAYIIPKDRVSIMPDAQNFFFKLIFAYPSGKILGAQAISKGDASKRIDVIAAAIRNHAGLEDIKELELTYSPHYSTAKDVVNHAALVGLNILNGEVKKVSVSQVRELVEQGAFIIDSREEGEFAAGHLKNAKNIPLSEFRHRLDEIPRDKPVYVHCRSGQRSYNMVRALMQRGYENVYNVEGSYLGICEYEYFNDKTLKREPILSEYNFN